MSSLTFKKGEVVIVHDGSNKRDSIQLAQIGQDANYLEQKVLITYGAFNSAIGKDYIHKLPATLKKALKEI